ncbi:helix-turn-helix domain-containing protein [Pseudomonas aeruginosa]|uniref:helix-turn-helix domain-containing protein n=1 Tax=Pseudomonas aeruginosa TaxID=287 RepID=UPI001E3CBC9F|nr:helix-turn-helix domain-containing protein [Pseudomonas aeruginosa]MCD2852695.1 helix-turn-helix domain-containing protein [Pseudomonas aeruginosa]
MSDQLRSWLTSATSEERERVARLAGTSVGHLYQLAGGHRKASPELAERLQDASSGKVTIAGLRPDLVSLAEKILRGAA